MWNVADAAVDRLMINIHDSGLESGKCGRSLDDGLMKRLHYRRDARRPFPASLATGRAPSGASAAPPAATWPQQQAPASTDCFIAPQQFCAALRQVCVSAFLLRKMSRGAEAA
jgi:hypothetical protein